MQQGLVDISRNVSRASVIVQQLSSLSVSTFSVPVCVLVQYEYNVLVPVLHCCGSGTRESTVPLCLPVRSSHVLYEYARVLYSTVGGTRYCTEVRFCLSSIFNFQFFPFIQTSSPFHLLMSMESDSPSLYTQDDEGLKEQILKQGMNKVGLGYTSFGMYSDKGAVLYASSSSSSDSDSSSDEEDAGGMRITVHVLDKSFNRSTVQTVDEVDHTFHVRVGDGMQTLRWLTLVVMERLETKFKRSGHLRKTRGTPGKFKPSAVISGDPETDAEFLTPDALLKEVLVDGEDLYVYL